MMEENVKVDLKMRQENCAVICKYIQWGLGSDTVDGSMHSNKGSGGMGF